METHSGESYDLPYRVTYSPGTGEVFVLGHNMNLVMAFLNPEAAERFVEEMNKVLKVAVPQALRDACRIVANHKPEPV